MIILDMPYVSGFLKDSVSKYQIPVIKTPNLDQFHLHQDTCFISEEEAIKKYKSENQPKLYTNSENAINWISKNLSFTDIPEKINLFKDKLLFRDLIKDLYPEVYYKGLSVDMLDSFDVSQVPFPFIIKPAIGFFSMAVYRVSSINEWPEVLEKIKRELKSVEGIYPREVMDTDRFIIESIIGGDEFAVDAYYDSEGNPVVLNIMKHVFASETDFSDRLYITSDELIREYLEEMKQFLRETGKMAELKNFPLHVELRKLPGKKPVPIEVNPLRFGAWCTTSDMTYMAYNFNSIQYFLSDNKPDWDKLLENKVGKIYAMMVLENSTGYKASQIESFNYDKLLSTFEKPLELRRINFNRYPVFGFLFAETRSENYTELEKILNSDLREYVQMKS